MSPLLLLASVLEVSLAQNCIFTDTISNQYTLDLSSLSGKQLEFYDASSRDANYHYNYTYSICSNDIWCVPKFQPEANVMVSQYSTDLNECYWLAKWDNGATQPIYNTTTKTWSFKYQGMKCDSAFLPERNTTVNWHCNSTVDYEISSIVQPTTCNYIITVESLYACAAYPGHYCEWQAGRGSLDLTSLSETTIIGKDAKESEMVFVYTPCRNGSKCENVDVMVKLDNVTASSGCDMYLALWENDMNGGIPTYDEEKCVWRFEYENGEMCGGLDSSLFVYWYCDESVVNPLYEVIHAEKIETCLYDISIASSLACGAYRH